VLGRRNQQCCLESHENVLNQGVHNGDCGNQLEYHDDCVQEQNLPVYYQLYVYKCNEAVQLRVGNAMYRGLPRRRYAHNRLLKCSPDRRPA
jgi:hypothetical protein